LKLSLISITSLVCLSLFIACEKSSTKSEKKEETISSSESDLSSSSSVDNTSSSNHFASSSSSTPEDLPNSSQITESSSSVTLVQTCTDHISVVYTSTGIKDCRDGQEYKTTSFLGRTWLAENLNYSGDDGAGNKNYTLGWCYGTGGRDTSAHQDSITCGEGYGRLYNWADAMDVDYTYLTASLDDQSPTYRGICPMGWHIPNSSEWESMTHSIDSLLMIDHSIWPGNDAKYLKDSIPEAGSYWNDPRYNADNRYGFSAIPSGYRTSGRTFISREETTNYWSSSETSATQVFAFWMEANYAHSFTGNWEKTSGISIRCLKD
jgi:uncharacterized protein (TIGR02145 family)